MFLRGNRYRVHLLSVQRGLNSKPFRYKAEIFAAVGENVGCPDILSFCMSRSISRLYGAGNCRLQYNTIKKQWRAFTDGTEVGVCESTPANLQVFHKHNKIKS